jgi:hypothetical protein
MTTKEFLAKDKRVFCALKSECDFKKQFLRKNRFSLKLDTQSALGKIIAINRSTTRNKMQKLYSPFCYAAKADSNAFA